jgi:hypothetical protein
MTPQQGNARVGCCACNDELVLDGVNVVGCAEISAFMAAHQHGSGMAITLTIHLDMDTDGAARSEDAATPFSL